MSKDEAILINDILDKLTKNKYSYIDFDNIRIIREGTILNNKYEYVDKFTVIRKIEK